MGKLKSYYWDKISTSEKFEEFSFEEHIMHRMRKFPIETLKVLSEQENTAYYAKNILKEKGVQE